MTEMLTIEKALEMSTEDLSILVWDWYKDVNGVRPRHMNMEDREAMLSFVEYELRPEVAEQRRQEWAEEEKQILEMENKYQEEMQTREFFDKYYAC